MSVSPHDSSVNGDRNNNPAFFKRADDGTPSPCHDTQFCRPNAFIDCGWGRLLYGPSYESPQSLAQALQEEQPGKRDIALHVESPQLVLAEAPSHLFLDPSLIFRRLLGETPEEAPVSGIAVRPLTTRADIAAISLYRKLGFGQAPGFVVKNKNAINEKLFVESTDFGGLNLYAMIIINEARRRGISVEVIDATAGIFKLRNAGHEMLCRESLTELTGGVAMTWCQDKVLTSRRLSSIGLRVPRQQVAGDSQADTAFLRECGSVVVKPALGEQGKGISVDVRTEAHLAEAIRRAEKEGGHVVIEEYCAGQDLRIVVIGYKVAAAAIRKPAEIVGDGTSTVSQLFERQSARRAAATGGESRIPVDTETERCLAGQGLDYDSVLETGRAVKVRKTANLHTGGTIHDVTDELHPLLREVAETAARALRISVVGLDFIVPSPDSDQYVIIEANERPGLANHDPQPTAQRFVDPLFPFTAAQA